MNNIEKAIYRKKGKGGRGRKLKTKLKKKRKKRDKKKKHTMWTEKEGHLEGEPSLRTRKYV